MGNVQAKGISKSERYDDVRESQASKMPLGVKTEYDKGNKVDLKNVKARVDYVTIEGIGRTKDDYIEDQVRELFKARNFYEVIVNVHKVREQLENCGCFRNVGTFIDVSTGPGSTPDGFEVLFNVKEHRKLTGGVNTFLGNNEASLLMGLRAPNLCGRGERVEFEYSLGSRKTSNLAFSFIKPLKYLQNLSLKSTIFQHCSDYPESGCSQVERGFNIDMDFSSLEKVKHKLRYEAAWRELGISQRNVAFEVREDAGHSLKSSLKHVFVIDKRDSVIFPKRGLFVTCSNELAGLGGNIGFIKNDLNVQVNVPLLSGFVLQSTAQFGTLHPLFENKSLGISDKFFFGGPMSVRGFRLYGIGPRVDGSFLGSHCMWGAGLHLFGPLPFLAKSGGLSDLFRVHLFSTIGNSDNFEFGDDYGENMRMLLRGYRLSYGCGLAIRLAQVARIEINYVVPVSYQPNDLICPGLQFGVGVNFL